MSSRTSVLTFAVLCATSCFLATEGLPRVLSDKAEPGFFGGKGIQRVQSPGKKSCAEVYPVPEAAKHWTECKQGEYSQCGGPVDCACKEEDDRLIWYYCKEGSYALCEDDNTCKDNSQVLPPRAPPQNVTLVGIGQ